MWFPYYTRPFYLTVIHFLGQLPFLYCLYVSKPPQCSALHPLHQQFSHPYHTSHTLSILESHTIIGLCLFAKTFILFNILQIVIVISLLTGLLLTKNIKIRNQVSSALRGNSSRETHFHSFCTYFFISNLWFIDTLFKDYLWLPFSYNYTREKIYISDLTTNAFKKLVLQQ